MFSFSPSLLGWLIAAIFGYAALLFVESFGLRSGRRWGEYFSVVATSVFLPWEEPTESGVTDGRQNAFLSRRCQDRVVLTADRWPRCGSSWARMAARGLAPMNCTTISPSTNSASVGIPMTL